MIYLLPDRPKPVIANSCYVAPSADVIGWVELAEQSSVWFNAVLRGDNEPIRIGADSNIQDCSVLHTDPGAPLTIDERVTVGHGVVLHGCHIQANSLIGIGSIILNGAVVGKNCLVGANTFIAENKSFPDGCLILGSPAKVVRDLTDEEIATVSRAYLPYVEKIPRYRQLSEVSLDV